MARPTIGSLCSGYAGLDSAVAEVLGAEPVWFAEIDPAASKVLAHHWPDVPNQGDLTTFDWSAAEPVDVITAGWPCQPWSQAGKRKGAEDERAIWPAVAAAIRTVRPRLVVLENVSAIAGVGELARACGDLAEAGYDSCWACVRASDDGAPHRRERLFLVAADPEGVGWGEGRPEPAGLVGGSDVALGGDAATDWAGYGPAIRRWERILGRPAPAPTVLGRRGGRQLNPLFVEWLMGLPAGWVCDVPGLTRNQQLKVLGNGVVPQQAAAALRHLLPLLLTEEVAAA